METVGDYKLRHFVCNETKATTTQIKLFSKNETEICEIKVF